MSNDLLFILILIAAFSTVLVGLKLGREGLLATVIIFTLTSNMFVAKLSMVFGVVTSLALPLYAAVFLATHLLIEHYDPKDAFRAVWLGFLAQVSLVLFGYLIKLGEPFGDPTASNALNEILSYLPRLVIASFIAYITSQNLNVYLYKLMKLLTGSKHLGLRNFLSTAVSQFIDTVIFVGIAFWGVIDNIGLFIVSYWLLKVFAAAIDTPFIYLSYLVLGKKRTV
ncbi:queuosine precursor transporter [bacterium]|nr:queuosine precursor transporter [bacterium]